MGVVRQAESAALKAAGLTETGKKSGTFKRELAAVFSQVKLWAPGRGREGQNMALLQYFLLFLVVVPEGLREGREGGVEWGEKCVFASPIHSASSLMTGTF